MPVAYNAEAPLAALGFGRYPADAVTDTHGAAFYADHRPANRREALGRGLAQFIFVRYLHDSASCARGFMGSFAR